MARRMPLPCNGPLKIQKPCFLIIFPDKTCSKIIFYCIQNPLNICNFFTIIHPMQERKKRSVNLFVEPGIILNIPDRG